MAYEKERYERKHIWKRDILFVVVLASLLFAAYVVAQTFDAPMVDQGISELEILETGGRTGGTAAAIPVVIDSDGDGMSDWFEENYAHTDPRVANDRYALYLTTFYGEYREGDTWWTPKDIFLHFMEKNKVPRENIIIDNATTFSEFRKYIDWLAEKSDENDFVYIYLHSHGLANDRGFKVSIGPNEYTVIREPGPTMEFADKQGNEHGGEIVRYLEIGKMLNRIKCNKMLVVTDSCAYNASVEPLSEGAKYPRVSMAPTGGFPAIGSPWTIVIDKELPEIDPITGGYRGKVYWPWTDPRLVLARKIYEREFADGPYGAIGEEFLTVKTWLEYSKNMGWIYDITKISDEYNISGEFYFGEAKVKDLYKFQEN